MDSQKPSKGFPSAAPASPEFSEPAKVDTSPEISDACSPSIPENLAKGALLATPVLPTWLGPTDKTASLATGREQNDVSRPQRSSPLTKSILAYPVPSWLKLPHCKEFHGVEDPYEHVNHFLMTMRTLGLPDQISCKIFTKTLHGDALRWYESLPNGTVHNFTEFSQLFVEWHDTRSPEEEEKPGMDEPPRPRETEWSKQQEKIRTNILQERPCAWMDFALDANIGSPPCELGRALITHRISFNLLFLAAVVRLKLLSENLKLRASSAELPDGTTVPTVGVITLPVQVGRHSEPVQYDVQFVVIEADSPYDAIFGSLVLDTLDHDVSMSGRMANKGSILRSALHGFDTPASKLPWISNDTTPEPKPEKQSARKDRANLALIEEAEPQAPTNLQPVDASRKRKGQQQQFELLTQSRTGRSQGLLSQSPHGYTPLNTSREHILSIICNNKVINWPRALSSHRGDQSQFCHFHKGRGHQTEHCAKLKEEIERLVQLGHLEAFRKETQKSATKDQPPGHGRPPY